MRRNCSNLSENRFLIIVISWILIVNGNLLSITSIFSYEVHAGSGAPPFNGTTNETWYVDSFEVRMNEWINTSDIQVNDSGSLEWHNIIAEVSGNISVNNNGYFNLTNCTVMLNGNFTINGSVILRNVILKMNCTFDGEYNIEVFGSMHILDWDSDNSTKGDGSFLMNGTTGKNYMFWVREGSNFQMVNSKMTSCGYGGFNRGLTIQANNTIVTGNELINNDNGLVLEWPSTGNNITGNTIQYGGTGILIDSSSSNNISWNIISNCFYGIVIAQSSNNNITFNTVMSTTDGFNLILSSNNNISWCTVKDNKADGIEMLSSTNNSIFHNTISNNNNDGIDLDPNSDYNTISTNTISLCVYGTLLTLADQNTIVNNTYMNNINSSIGLYQQSTNNKILKNRCTGSLVGIGSLSADENVYKENKLWSNMVGLVLSNSSNNNITYNNITLNTFTGIALNSSSSNNQVHYNIITGNFLNGLYVENAASTVNATYNWWGSWSGPYHENTNPSGTGDSVTDYVIYRPWGLYNVLPEIDVENEINVEEDTYYEKVYFASDKNGDSIIWSQWDNTSWLEWGDNNHTLFGRPTNKDVGSYFVVINVSDAYGGYKESNITLNVTNIAPIMIGSEINTISEDSYYYNDYNSTDDDSGIIKWELFSNASWLNLNNDTGELSGIPVNSDVGSFWINVTVDDGNKGLDWSYFILEVINVNDDPEIITKDILVAMEDELYWVDYEASDIDPTDDTLTWRFFTNATWLILDRPTGNLSGIPTNKNVGTYWVNVTVSDGNGGSASHNFTLTINNMNDDPIINTTDDNIAIYDETYLVDYNATDMDPTNDILTWSLDTNASFLTINTQTGELSGTPTPSDHGTYWVNVSVSDGKGGFDWQYYILDVIPGEQEPNKNPEITTLNKKTAEVGKEYNVEYNAIDDHTSDENLSWSFNTNASWLGFDEIKRELSGTPSKSDVGTYWVNISVLDDEDGSVSTNFTIKIPKPPKENRKPKLTNGKMTPSSGETDTEFTFSVHYLDEDGDETEYVKLLIDNKEQNMILVSGDKSNGTWEVTLKLTEGSHDYYFTANDGTDSAISGDGITPTSSADPKSTPKIEKAEEKEEDNSLLVLLALIIVIIVVFVLIGIIVKRSRKLGAEVEKTEERMGDLEEEMEEYEEELDDEIEGIDDPYGTTEPITEEFEVEEESGIREEFEE